MSGSNSHALLRAFGLCALAIIALLALLVIGWIKLGDVNARISHDEQKTCSIQSMGLSSTPSLVRSLDGIHHLLTLPLTPQQRRLRQEMPPKLLRRELRLVDNLNTNLATYVRIERGLPKARSC